MGKNLTKEEKVEWILENCIDKDGDIDLSDLDFSDVDKDVYISDMLVKQDLYQNNQEVQGNLYQYRQTVQENLFQQKQNVQGSLYQNNQVVQEDLIQGYQTVKGSLNQYNQTVRCEFYGHKLEDNEIWEDIGCCVQRVKKLKKINAKELAKLGYELED